MVNVWRRRELKEYSYKRGEGRTNSWIMDNSKWEVAKSNMYGRNVKNKPLPPPAKKKKSNTTAMRETARKSEKWSLQWKEKQQCDWLPAVPNVSPDVPRSPLPRWLYINLTLLLQMWFYWLCTWFTPRQRAHRLRLQGSLQTKRPSGEEGATVEVAKHSGETL